MRRLAALLLFLAPMAAAADELRLVAVRESLTGTYWYYRQYHDGLEVAGGDVIERVDPGGVVHSLEARTIAAPRFLRRVVHDAPFRPYAETIDAQTGAVVRREPLFWNAKARVFDVNPVAKLNAPSLSDQNNAASAVPEAAYTLADIPDDFAPAGLLAGPNVAIVDIDAPTGTAHADPSQPLLFDRSQQQFEEVNAYFLIDHMQRYLQSLGYVGSRRLVAYPIPVDPHAVGGADNSFFVSGGTTGRGQLFFGDGGTDDAEDGDIVLHEFMHAIQDWIAPGKFAGLPSEQSRALAEAIADYWAFSATYAGSTIAGRDPFCLGDWDARCGGDNPSENCGYPAGADCLRRVDSTKTMADYVVSDRSGQEHSNGEIWSSAMREIFMGIASRYGSENGKRLTDTIVLESMFGTPDFSTFAYEAKRLLESDRALTGGANGAAICSAMTSRGILQFADCGFAPHGEVTVFQSPQHGVAIPDGAANGVQSTLTIDDPRAIESVVVTVDIHHPAAGELVLLLAGPDGTSVVLQGAGTRTGPAGIVTYGRDIQTATSLDALRGKPARGTWTLTVKDFTPGNAGTINAWSLAIKFAGDVPPLTTTNRRVVPVVTHVSGANNTNYRTDLSLFNRGTSSATVLLTLTPQVFSARVVVPPQSVVVLRDVVSSFFAASGAGTLRVEGEAADVLVTTTIYNEDGEKRLGQTIEDVAASGGSRSFPLFPLANAPGFRTNIGFAELAGEAGVLRVGTLTIPIAAYGHVQIPAPAGDSVGVTVISGGSRIAGYVSMVDNVTGDATYFPAQDLPFPFQPIVVDAEVAPVAGRTGGVAGTFWRTEEWTYVPPAHTADAVSGFGPLTVNSGTALRIWTECLGGTCGDRIATRPVADAIGNGGVADVFPLEVSATARTNAGIAEVAGGTAVVEVTLYDAAGRQRSTSQHVVGPRSTTQFALTQPVVGGRVRFRVTGGDGRVLTYASVVNNATGDFAYVSGR